MSHTCHAAGCSRAIAPRLFACPQHWRRVHRALQAELWLVYEPGQEHRKDPTAEYMMVQSALRAVIACRETRSEAAIDAMREAVGWAERVERKRVARFFAILNAHLAERLKCLDGDGR